MGGLTDDDLQMTGNSGAAARLITSLRKKLQEGNKKSPVSTSAESKLIKTQEENLTKRLSFLTLN